MMNYEIFKEVVAEKFKDYLSSQYQDMNLRVEAVNKVNKNLDGLTLVSSEAGRNVSPTIYINDMYDHYLKTENLQEVLESAAKTMERAFSDVPVVGSLDFDSAKDNIVFQVINTVQNQDSVSKLLRMTPEEAKLLEKKAKTADMTESQYLRLMISQKPNDYPEVRQLLRDLINEVSVPVGWFL